MPKFRLLPALCLAATTLLLAGCGLGPSATAIPGTTHLAITGHVHGGQQPVSVAHVHVFQGINGGAASYDLIGYGGMPGLPTSGTDRVSTQDNLGYYVPTDANGNFNITGDYLCRGGGPVYLLATRGNPGLGANQNNAALALLSVVADACSSQATLSPTLQININEISTVAASYALSGYLNAPNALNYPGTTNVAPQGLTNAADTALALVNLSTGTVNATTASGGIVPTAAVTTLANILAPCVNSNGTGAACTTLFNNATSNGIPTSASGAGTVPTDTATAMLNIAHNAGVLAQYPAAMSALFALPTATPPFAGGLTTQPNDFSLAVAYTGANTGLNSPGIPAVDAAGNVWFASTVAAGGVYYANELSPLGARITYSTLSNQPVQAAIDDSGNAWFAVRSGGVVAQAMPQAAAANYPYYAKGNTNDDGHQIAIDSFGNVFVNDYTQGRVLQLANNDRVNTNFDSNYTAPSSGGVTLQNGTQFFSYSSSGSGTGRTYANGTGSPNGSGATCGNLVPCGLAGATALSVDSNQLFWAANPNNTLVSFASGAASGNTYTGGGLNVAPSPGQPVIWSAIDGGNNVWVPNYTGKSLSQFTNSGAALSPSAGLYGAAASCATQGLAIDGSGNVWVACDSATTPVLEYIGLAVPVTTPLLPGRYGVKP